MPPAEQLRIVVPRFGPEVVGGSEGLARRLAAALTARDWEIEVWSTTAVDESTWAGSLPPNERDPLGFSVRRFPVTRRRRPRAFALGSRAFFRLPPALRPERAWLRAQGPFAPALLAALRTARPAPTLFTPYLYYPTVFGLPMAPHPRLLMPAAHPEKPLRLRAIGSAISAADAIWYHTPEERELVESVHPASSQIPAAIGTVGVEPIAGDPSRFAASTGIQGPLLLYGGRLTPGKGGEVLLEGFRRLRAAHPEVTLVLAGSAPDGESPAGVVATGRLDETAWHDALAAATAVVVPSPMESLSLLSLEAWAAARPALLNGASPVLAGQARRSGGALLFSSPGELAAAAGRLLSDPAAARALGDSGRRHMLAEYSWDAVCERLIRLVATAADRGPH